MASFLSWCRGIVLSVLNGLARVVVVALVVVLALAMVTLARGDGLPKSMVLALDLRGAIADSGNGAKSALLPPSLTLIDLLLALDDASRDGRVKGVVLRIGDGAVSLAQAEEISDALARLRRAGKFVYADASAFNGAGLGDYVTAAAADQIWMQPKSDFMPAGTGLGEVFLRGLLDKVAAEPQIAKRAEYKSAADTFMEKTMTAPDHEQLVEVAQSSYDAGVAAIAAERHLSPVQVKAALEASPQLSEDALRAHLVDHIGYDDDLDAAALARAGSGAKSIRITDYMRAHDDGAGQAPIAVVEASGEIRDGTAGNSFLGGNSGIASDDLSAAIAAAAKDKAVKAIVLRVDFPGGSVSASDQILHAVKKAQGLGKPVVVSMGGVAASGGYYISASADRIVAEPATLTGSIGVLTGKVSVGKSLGLIGVSGEEVSVGKNTLMDSTFTPYTPDQWVNLNHEADVIYDDFTAKVAAGRKLPLATVRDIARGRVWTGADARARGLVDETGGFWSAARLAARLGGVPENNRSFRIYPRRLGFLRGVGELLGGLGVDLGFLQQVHALLDLPALHAVLGAAAALPHGGVEMRAGDLAAVK